jgi:hypothetical protein
MYGLQGRTAQQMAAFVTITVGTTNHTVTWLLTILVDGQGPKTL